jgi:RecA/RadA recombinase
MARSKNKEIEVEGAAAANKEEMDANDPSVILGKYLTANKADHYNFEENVDYIVSTGSLNLDMELGGIGPGVTRLAGGPGTGKTSEALEIIRNFFLSVPNSRAVYIKSEGRLSDDIKQRSGLNFTSKWEDWKDGNVFVFECNIYETIIDLIRDLSLNNDSDKRYLFIVDSADSVNLKNDIVKKIEEGNKVAGAPLLTKQFLQKCSLSLTKYGHICIFISQVSADIKLDPYSRSAPRQVGGSGGNAIGHFANQVLEFMEWYEGDLILEDPKAKHDRIKNRALGHTAKVKIKKSDKEKRYVTVEIPIKHNQVGGNSIWREREIADQLLTWQLISPGAWMTLSDVLIKELNDNGLENIPVKINGSNQLNDWLEKRKDVTNYLFNKFRNMVNSATKKQTS